MDDYPKEAKQLKQARIRDKTCSQAPTLMSSWKLSTHRVENKQPRQVRLQPEQKNVPLFLFCPTTRLANNNLVPDRGQFMHDEIEVIHHVLSKERRDSSVLRRT